MSWLRQEDADFSDPMQAMLWAMCGIPIDADGTQIALPMHAAAYMSKHLDDCGFVHVPERQKIRRRPGDRVSEAAPLGVEWVPVEAGEVPERSTDMSGGVNIDGLSDAECEQLRLALDARQGRRP